MIFFLDTENSAPFLFISLHCNREYSKFVWMAFFLSMLQRTNALKGGEILCSIKGGRVELTGETRIFLKGEIFVSYKWMFKSSAIDILNMLIRIKFCDFQLFVSY